MILVSDSSVLIDLERGALLEIALRSPLAMAVPDLLFNRELKPQGGQALLDLGLQVVALEPDEVEFSQQVQRDHPRLSLPDCFALSYARRASQVLLTGDRELRTFAESQDIECHGVLWLLDQLLALNPALQERLLAGLRDIAGHPRCRLPKAAVTARLDAWGSE